MIHIIVRYRQDLFFNNFCSLRVKMRFLNQCSVCRIIPSSKSFKDACKRILKLLRAFLLTLPVIVVQNHKIGTHAHIHTYICLQQSLLWVMRAFRPGLNHNIFCLDLYEKICRIQLFQSTALLCVAECDNNQFVHVVNILRCPDLLYKV